MAIVAAFTAHRERRFRVTPKTRGPHQRPPASRFTETLLAVTLAAIAYACVQAQAGRSALTGDALAVVVAWAAYHVVTATRLLLLERRCEKDRRTSTRFHETLLATIAHAADPRRSYAVDIVVASADGFALRVHDGSSELPAGDYRGELHAGAMRVPFELTVRAGSAAGSVRWPDDATRTAFDALLHQRAIERIAAAQCGDRGGVFRSAGVSRPRYPKPRPSRVLQRPETPPTSPS